MYVCLFFFFKLILFCILCRKRKSSAKDEGPAPKKAKAESKPKKPVLSKEETAMKVSKDKKNTKPKGKASAAK